jgi:uncharacterized membrane protein YjjP (DUF1212 family)
MSERADTYSTLDLALRVGEVMLASGAGAVDVSASMLSVTHACGLRGVTADVTFTELSLQHQRNIEEPAEILVRRLTHRYAEYGKLTLVESLVHDLLDSKVTRDQAREAMAKIMSSPRSRTQWAVTLGWGVMGAAVSLTLGGGPAVTGLAFLSAAGIDRIHRGVARGRVPDFYLQVAGGLLATLIAVGAAATHIQADPSQVVTAGIMTLLAGVGFMGATQDALTGYPLTASARLLEAVLATTGIIAGVSGGLTVGRLLGVDLGRLEPGATGLTQASTMIVGAGLAAAAFGFASHGPWRSLAAAALVAALAYAVLLAVQTLRVGQAMASSAAAITIGVVCYAVADRMRVPPLIVVVPALVPLLPGLEIYRGLSLLAVGGDGVLALVTAGATAIALAAGVILGQYLAKPIKKEGRWLESRLGGTRMVGPRRGSSRRGRRRTATPEADEGSGSGE